jgi:Leucine-rich repeat (LRR) protein
MHFFIISVHNEFQMKTIIHFVCGFFLIPAFSFTLSAGNIYRYQVTEAGELNKLGTALSISGKKGWPVSPDETSVYPDIWGVKLVLFETAKRKQGEDSIFVNRYKVREIDFSSQQLAGTLPVFALDSCKLVDLSGNRISGTLPAMVLPECKTLLLSSNNFSGVLPDLNLPKIELLSVSSNEFSGQLGNFTKMPNLTTLNIEYNKFTSIASPFTHPTLTNLEYTGWSGTQISGELPMVICPSLKKLRLIGHLFSGEIPRYDLPECTELGLSDNQLTGNLPDLIMPSLEELDINYNKLSGPIGPFSGLSALKHFSARLNQFESISAQPNLPDLETLDAAKNKLSGELTNLNLPKLTRLTLSDNLLSGTVPNLNLPMLLELDLSRNNFTGQLPAFSLPSLEILNISYNKLAGAIPDFKMPKLKKLELQYNTLTGPITALNYPELTLVSMKFNQIEGPLPALNLPEATEIYLEFNKLSGNLPELYLPRVEIMFIQYNKITGPIPALTLPKVKYLDLSSNLLEGPLPSFDFPAIKELNFSDNKLAGVIPSLNLPLLTSLQLSTNKLTGFFDNNGLAALSSLGLENNLVDSIPKLRTASPNLNSAHVRRNKLHFGHIENNLDIRNFYYENQDTVEHVVESLGAVSRLVVRTPGTANKYQWMKKTGGVWTEIAGATAEAYTTVYTEGDVYACKITSTLAPKLTLYTRLGEASRCFSLAFLEFCNESGPWRSGEKNELTSNGTVVINDLVVFSGSITIDTVKLTLHADGEFYITDIPLPGGNQIGKLTLSEGKYDLKLLGKEGAITDFANATIKNYLKIAGIDFKFTDIKLVGGRKATDLKVDCKIGIPGIAGKCDDDAPPDKKAEITLKGLNLNRANGISLNEVQVENMSLYVKDFCLKKLLVKYDGKKNIIAAGLGVQLPFGEVEGGFKLEGGFLDSIGWRLEAAKPPFVLGATTIGIKGFFGHISSITNPAIEVELGGIFSDILSDNFYVVDASGRTIWPSLFEIKGAGKFMKPPLLKLPYQMNAEVTMAYDHPLTQFKVGFDGKIGTADEKKWLLTANGSYVMSLKFAQPKFGGQVAGKLDLPKFSDKFPYNWLGSMFTFPIVASTEATFVWGNSQLLHGSADFSTKDYGPFRLRYVINLAKEYGSEDFLWFETDLTVKSSKLKSGNLQMASHEMDIPENAEFAVIGIMASGQAPASTLTNPAGKSYTATSGDDKIVLSSAAGNNAAFWTISQPAKGKWMLNIQNQDNVDSIIWFVQKPAINLEIVAIQTGRTVTVTWDGSGFDPDTDIDLMLDDDQTGFDGFSVASGKAAAGTLSFVVSDSLSACRYYLFGQVSGPAQTVKAYADNPVVIPKTILMAPEFRADLDVTTGHTIVRFADNLDLHTAGYIITVASQEEGDSIYAVIARHEGTIGLDIKNYGSKSVSITSYGYNGLQGCTSTAKPIVTAVNKPGGNAGDRDEILFYPNPTTGKGTIRIHLISDEEVGIFVTDMVGRAVKSAEMANVQPGTHEFPMDLGTLPGGFYLIVMRTSRGFSTTRCVLTK